MRKLILLLFIFISCKSFAQPFNNEWINYNNTYYKFKVGSSGLFQINQASLATINLQNTPVEQFQLWRNGKQVPLYTTIPTGIMGSSDYIEFWGEQNDGVPDKYLYKDSSFQHNNRVSLQTDTAAFYLTVNSSPTASNPNLRFTNAADSIPASPPAPDPYFTYKLRYNFKTYQNPGFAENAGEYIYSSSYDEGEFWSTNAIYAASPFTTPIDSLYAYPSGPVATLQAGFAANNTDDSRTMQLNFNNDNTNVVTGQITGMHAAVFSNNNIPLSTLTASPTNFNISINSSDPYDNIVCSYIELQYPRQFNFGGKPYFWFNLAAGSVGQAHYLQITNFQIGNVAPVLYDFTNKQRYVGNISTPGMVQFYLPASVNARTLLLISENPTQVFTTVVSSFETHNFINFSLPQNQGSYMIISNKILGLTPGGAVYNYYQYRSSQYNAKIYDIDELVDQFGYGIKKYPLSIKNFMRYANSNFTAANKPAYVCLIGKGVTYDQYRGYQFSPYADQLNLVPTWGWPASDVLLVSPTMDPQPTVGVGRISAVSQNEVNIYLSKVKEYEGQLNNPQTQAGKEWMKQVVLVSGTDDPSLYATINSYLNKYQQIITGPSFGGTVATFNKTTTGPVTSAYNTQLINLFNSGIGLITYFGHGSATVLDYANLNDPYAFDNPSKYPVFLVDGCSVGAFFDYDMGRLSDISNLSEQYIFASERGAIGFIGNSHFGLTNYLDTYTSGFYTSLSSNGYNAPVSTNTNAGIAALKANAGGSFGDYYTRTHAEETILAGDPAMKIYASQKPDFDVEQQDINISPSVISVSDTQFVLKVYLHNLGMATTDTFVSLLIQRTYPNGTVVNLFDTTINNFPYEDSITIPVHIVGSRDKGLNQITVNINNTRKIDEITYANNIATVSFGIFDNGITPVYPYNYAIVNKPTVQFVASTANPLSASAAYVMDIDTTALFNSPFKITTKVTSIGGAIVFNPNITFTDSTVYYWRVATAPTNGQYVYSNSSFVYLKNSSTGYNQSHLYQHLQSSMLNIYLDSNSRKWGYLPDSNNIVIRQAIYPTSGTQDAQFATLINGLIGPESACVGNSIIFNVYDPIRVAPWYNQAAPSIFQQGAQGGFMGSANGSGCVASGRQYNFEYEVADTTGRRLARDFLNWLSSQSSNYIITARLNYDITNNTPLVGVWQSDTSVYGSGPTNTLYNKLKSIGFIAMDSFYFPRTFVLIYKNNLPSFQPKWKFSNGLYDPIDLDLNISAPDTLGYITSPLFGPVSKWHSLHWRGAQSPNPTGDGVIVYVVGVDSTGVNQTILDTLGLNTQDLDISAINAVKYPYLRLMMRNSDSIYLAPYQLSYWRLLADLVPEGAMAPNVKYSFNDTVNPSYASTDTFHGGQYIKAAIAFKNISDTSFRDSIQLVMQILDNNNNTTTIPFPKLKKLVPNDTAVIYTTINASNYPGNNTLFINVNPNNAQPEQYHFNNFIYKSFYVVPDNTNPILDVTFDGVHILNNDIVSSKPAIKIRLQDNSKYLLLNDTSLVTVMLVYPDGSTHRIKYDGDTLRFTPATASSPQNAAIVDFYPYLPQDGTYELLVSGKDRTGNPAGLQQYKVIFQVVNTPAISNVFNYPNPFTTSTAFVFTLTGSEVPQNIKIEILTVTGKIIKEITREQLGNIHIGNNITTYKWDGTDMYGAKVGNGVYLYRVVTRLNGNTIGKVGSQNLGGANTDSYFKGGYGKMYLMR